MWPFSRRNTTPARPNLFDIHNHCLFHLDDGAADITESRAMLDGLFQMGFRGIIATPHYNHTMFETPSADQIANRLAALSNLSETEFPTVIAGAEIAMRDRFREKMNNDEFPGIGGAYLLEFGNQPGEITPGFNEFLFDFQQKGRTAVLAHVERYQTFQNTPELLYEFRRRGAVVQLDIMSLSGRYGPGARRFAWQLIENNAVDIVATDIHSSADLPLIEKSISALFDHDAVQFARIASSNPQALFESRPQDIPGE